jgi:hypothetical protein
MLRAAAGRGCFGALVGWAAAFCLVGAARAQGSGTPAGAELAAEKRELSPEAGALAAELATRLRAGTATREWLLMALQRSTHETREALLAALVPPTDAVRSPSAGIPDPGLPDAAALREALLAGARSLSSPPEPTQAASAARAAEASIALEILEALGRAPDLAAAVNVTLAAAGTSEDTALARAFERAAQALLARDTKTWDVLRSIVANVPLALAARLLAAAGACDTPLALQSLGLFLDHDAELDAATLSHVARLCVRFPDAIQPNYAERLCSFLGSPDAPVREQAALVVGRLEHEASTGKLIVLQFDEAPGVRANACWALQRISGLSYRAGDRRWQEWYDAETTWWVSKAPEVFDELGSRNRATLVAAVHELSRHRLARKELVSVIADLTYEADPELVALACKSLGSLGSRTAIPVLLEVLEQPEDLAREAAGAALSRITGLEVPADAEAWSAALPPATGGDGETSAAGGQSLQQAPSRGRGAQALRPSGR